MEVTVNFMLRPFYPLGNNSHFHWMGVWVDPIAGFDVLEKRTINLFGSKPESCSPKSVIFYLSKTCSLCDRFVASGTCRNRMRFPEYPGLSMIFFAATVISALTSSAFYLVSLSANILTVIHVLWHHTYNFMATNVSYLMALHVFPLGARGVLGTALQAGRSSVRFLMGSLTLRPWGRLIL